MNIRIILNTDYVLKQYFAYIGLNILFIHSISFYFMNVATRKLKTVCGLHL